MISGGDTGAGENVLDESEDKSLTTEGDKTNADEKTDEWRKDDGCGEPVNTLQEGKLAEFLVSHVLGSLRLFKCDTAHCVILDIIRERGFRWGIIAHCVVVGLVWRRIEKREGGKSLYRKKNQKFGMDTQQ